MRLVTKRRARWTKVAPMRRLLSCAIALLLVLHAAVAAARGAGACCIEGCGEMAACVQAPCHGCMAQAVEPAAARWVGLPPHGAALPAIALRRWSDPGPDIWRPPR